MAKRKRVKPGRQSIGRKVMRQQMFDEASVRMANATPMSLSTQQDYASIYQSVGFSKSEAASLGRTHTQSYNQRQRMAKTRTIDKQLFKAATTPTNRSTADRVATQLRDKNGLNARIIKTNPAIEQWTVFVAPKNRKYNATLINSRPSLLARSQERERQLQQSTKKKTKKKKKKWFRRKNILPLPLSHEDSEDLLEDSDFERLVQQYGGKSSPEGVARAMREAQASRRTRAAEKKRGIDIAKAERDYQTSQTRRREVEYESAIMKYEQGVPLDTLVRYNSLEIATTSTGAAIGFTLAAATTAVSAGAIPIAALIGLGAAKLIRRQPVLKGSVNQFFDTTESIGKGFVGSLRESKDEGTANRWTLGIMRQPDRPKPEAPSSLKVRKKREQLRSKRDAKETKQAEKRAVKSGKPVLDELAKIQRKRERREARK